MGHAARSRARKGVVVARNPEKQKKLNQRAVRSSSERLAGEINATRDRNFTWLDYYREGASALGKSVNLLFLPAATIVKADPPRFGLLREITQFHGAYSSAKAKRDVPEFSCRIDFPQGVKETLEDLKRRNQWKSASDDKVYESLVKQAQQIQ